MTLPEAASRLSASVEEVWLSVCELVLTVHEDRPSGCDLAAVDDLAERVSELQGEVAAARVLLSPGEPLLAALPRIAAHLDAAHLRYWRDMRGFGAVAALRGISRRRGGGLPAWQGAVEASAARCEEPLAAAMTALNACWQEICLSSNLRRSS